MASITITQSPAGIIKSFPRELFDAENTYPRDWRNAVYADATFFTAQLSGVPAGYLFYQWYILAHPDMEDFRLRRTEAFPPGLPLATRIYFRDVDSVWLPIITRRALDNGLNGREFTDYTIKCNVKICRSDDEDDTIATIEGSLPLVLETTNRAIGDYLTLEKVELAIRLSAPYWPAAVANEALNYFTDPYAVSLLVSTTGVFVAISFYPTPITLFAGAIFGTILTVHFGVSTVTHLIEVLSNLYDRCKSAKTPIEIEYAGRKFAEEAGVEVFNLLTSLVLWRVGRATSSAIGHVRKARSEFLQRLTQAENTIGGIPLASRQSAAISVISNSKYLVRRMSLSEFFKTKYATKESFIPGREGNKAFSLDTPYKFKNEHLKKFRDYWIKHKIEINADMKAFLERSINDRNIPTGIDKSQFPRYKYETGGRVNVLIPEAIFNDFVLNFADVTYRVIPVNPTSTPNGYYEFTAESEDNDPEESTDPESEDDDDF